MQRLNLPLRAVAVVVAGAMLLTGTVVGVGPRLWALANAHEELPVVLPEFEPLSQRTTVYDNQNNVIAVFERENSQPIEVRQVPDQVIAALLAVEDTEFYSHKGVNLRGFLRALLSNFASDGPTQGASTITQQVVKNEFLAGLPRDGRYKALQAHYATMLEKTMSKDAILERYLNTVFFGNNAYGLKAAAEVYFGKPVERLTLVEGAFLAGLVRSPSGYDPIRNPEPSRRRFVQVMERLADVGIMPAAQAAVVGKYWELPSRVRTISTITTKQTYFTVTLRDYLLTRSNILGATEQERANALYRRGLQIHTTLDPLMQTHAQNARNILPDNSVGFDAAVVSLDTATGAVRAMVGGKGLRDNVPGGQVNMALVPRQTGSSVKALILAAAYEAGAEREDIINGPGPCTVPDFVDGQMTEKVVDNASGELGPLDGKNTWSSSDCGFIRLSYAVGLHRLVDSVYRFSKSPWFYQGQDTADHEPFLPLPLSATGNNAMSTMDMASGMQTILNLGVHRDPYLVQWIDAADGTRFYTHDDPGVQALDSAAALKTVQSLKGVLRSGTGARNLRNFSRPAAGKTGTQYENTNAWFVGGNPQVTTAVWVGDPNGYTPMVGIPEFAAEMGRGGKVQGADYPARIWGAYMEAVLQPLPVVDWPAAPPALRPPARLYVPGEECLARLVSGTLPVIPGVSTTTSTTTTTTTVPATDPVDTGVVTPPPSSGPASSVPGAVVEEIESGTLVPDVVRDPRAPMPSIDLQTFVYLCGKPPPGVVVQTVTT